MRERWLSGGGRWTRTLVVVITLVLSGCAGARSSHERLPIIDTDADIRVTLTSIVAENDRLILTFLFEDDRPDSQTIPPTADLGGQLIESSLEPVDVRAKDESELDRNGAVDGNATPIRELDVVLRSPGDLSQTVWIAFTELHFEPDTGSTQVIRGRWEFRFTPDRVVEAR